MKYATIETAASTHGLTIYGGFHGSTADGLPEKYQTLLLLGPATDFWDHIQTQPEMKDDQPDPIDRWSTRIIQALAYNYHATPFLPFGGPPYAPFLNWALKTDRAWSSPVGMLVHDQTGLMVSYRGALAFRDRLDLPETGTSPCLNCPEKPCRSSCPVDALSAENGYDTGSCHKHLTTAAGTLCLDQGCHARRACPISAGAKRKTDQSAHHMRYFHKGALRA